LSITIIKEYLLPGDNSKKEALLDNKKEQLLTATAL